MTGKMLTDMEVYKSMGCSRYNNAPSSVRHNRHGKAEEEMVTARMMWQMFRFHRAPDGNMRQITVYTHAQIYFTFQQIFSCKI
jgi:hypothetical protein